LILHPFSTVTAIDERHCFGPIRADQIGTVSTGRRVRIGLPTERSSIIQPGAGSDVGD
jgi:hypothetical protein